LALLLGRVHEKRLNHIGRQIRVSRKNQGGRAGDGWGSHAGTAKFHVSVTDVNRAAFADGDKATAQLLLNTFLDIGLDQVIGPHLAFVNVTRNFVFSEYCESLTKGRVVLEIPPDSGADGALVERLSQLAQSGYSIALDNFVYNEEFRPLLQISDIVKLNVQALDRDALTEHVRALREYVERQQLSGSNKGREN
jgi:EAL and modified HD-GYP domain-containing signal transduction protein